MALALLRVRGTRAQTCEVDGNAGSCSGAPHCAGLALPNAGCGAELSCCVYRTCAAQTGAEGVCRAAPDCAGTVFERDASQGCSVLFPAGTVCCVPRAADTYALLASPTSFYLEILICICCDLL